MGAPPAGLRYGRPPLVLVFEQPEFGEGLRLREPDGFWASYDVIDVWYQKAEFGEIWVPYIHVRMTDADQAVVAAASQILSQREPQPLRA